MQHATLSNEGQSQDNSGASLPRLLTIEEVAGYLHVSKRTVEHEIQSGRLGMVRIRGARRFRLEDVEAYLNRCHTDV